MGRADRRLPGLLLYRICIAGLFAFALVAQGANAQSGRLGVKEPAPVVPRAVPIRTLPPLRPQTGTDFRALGRHPRLYRLPRLPLKTAANTVARSQARGRLRPMAANGDTLTITTVTGCGSDSGQIYAEGCEIDWSFAPGGIAPAGTDELEDCYASNTTPNTLATCGTAYTGTDPGQDTTLNSNGTWVFGTLDTTTGTWLSVAYLPVGTGVYLDTFSDTYYTTQSSQFSAASATTVYIEATGLTAGDRYEVYVESNSVDPTCVYTAPAESPAAPLTNTLCNPSSDTGDLTAPSGTLQVPWPLSSSYSPGQYAIVLWDVSAGERLAQRQVSLNSGSVTLTATTAGGNPSPDPAPAGTPSSTFAFDSTTEDADKDIVFDASGLPTKTDMIGTVTDPTGQVIKTFTASSGAAGTFDKTFTFTNSEEPSNYPLDTYTYTIYDETSGAVVASEGFRIVGYQITTQFTNPVGTGLTLNSPQTTGLEFINTGNANYGTSNGDPIAGIYFDTGAEGITLSLLSGTSCGTNCQTETIVDSAGVSWAVTSNCTTGTTAECTLYAYPATTGESLALGANLTIPNVQFTSNSGTNCKDGCIGQTEMLPLDGLTWSTDTLYVANNPVYFTDDSTYTYGGSAHIYLYGYRDSGGNLHLNQEAHGYTVRAVTPGDTTVSYTATSPSSTGTALLEYALTVTNNSTTGSGDIKKLGLLLPLAMSGNTASYSVDTTPTGAANWAVTTCPNPQKNSVCFIHNGSNAGIPPGSSQTLYIEAPPPTTSFIYTDIGIETAATPYFGISPDGTWEVFADTSNPTMVDTTALVGYSLDDALMSVTTSPSSIGTGTSQSVSFDVTNTSTVQDANPDSVDAVVISVPSANTLSSFSVSTPGWSELGSIAAGANTEYVFGLCASQFNAAYLPPNDGMPSCGTATEQADALAPGASLTFSAKMAAGGSSAVAMNMYAHGANGNGWSAAKSFSETVTPISLSAGFSQAGTIGSPTTFSNGTEPSVGADSSTTLGNTFVYSLSNTSGSGTSNNVTSITITIPGSDVSGNNGTDSSGQNWEITSAPALSGSGFSGCSVTSYSSPTTGGSNGQIVIGGSSCALTPGGTMNVTFDAKEPYKVNDVYRFSATANAGAVIASETWMNDTEMEIVLSANLNVIVDPAPDENAGTDPSPNCPACTFGPSLIDFGSVTGSVVGTDVAEVDVTTDAASPVGWQLYVSASENPANTGGSYSNVLLVDVDSAHSISGAGVNYDQTSLGVVPTTGVGLELLDTGSGASVRRNPYGFVITHEIYINGSPAGAVTSTLTYTFIAN